MAAITAATSAMTMEMAEAGPWPDGAHHGVVGHHHWGVGLAHPAVSGGHDGRLVEELDRADDGEQHGQQRGVAHHGDLDLPSDLPLAGAVDTPCLVELVRDGLQRGEEDEHVVAGVSPGGHVGHGCQQRQPRRHEVGVHAEGVQRRHDRANRRRVQAQPHHRGDDAGDGVRQEVGQPRGAGVADHEAVQQQGQRQGEADHDRHLDEGVPHHAEHAVPEIAAAHHVLVIFEADELLHLLAAAVQPAAGGLVLEEGAVDGYADGEREHQQEHEQEWGEEGPSGDGVSTIAAAAASLG